MNWIKKNPYKLWLIVFVLCGTFVSISDFKSSSNDSKFYNRLVVQLDQQPIGQWIAPKWGDNYWGHSEDKHVHDHLVGNIVSGVILAKAGIPAKHALHVLQMAYQILSIFLLILIVRFFIKDNPSNYLMWCLMLVPIGFTYAIRANHEQAMMFYNLLAVYGALKMTESFKWVLLVILGTVAMFLIKGLPFVMVPAMAIGVHFIASQNNSMKFCLRPYVGIMTSYLVVILSAFIYEWLYRKATGVDFFAEYWRVQFMERSYEIEAEYSMVIQKFMNFKYYLSRSFFYSAPWSLIVLGMIVYRSIKGSFNWSFKSLRKYYLTDQGAVIACLLFCSLVYVLMFSAFDRTASRYIFPAFYTTAAALIIYVFHESTFLKKIDIRISNRVGGIQLAAFIYLVSIVVHLVF